LAGADTAVPQLEFANTIANGAFALPGYSRCRLANAEVVALDALRDAMCEAVRAHGTLYAWASGTEQPRALRGRAPVYVATIPGTEATVVVRHSWHGGLFAPITGDRFLRPTRAPVELLRSYMLRECAIPTPEIAGFALYAAGPGFARVDVASRYIPESYDLAAVLAELAPGISRAEAFDALEVLLNQLAQHGFTHPDLNVKNILLYREGRALVAAVLDVDVVHWDRKAAVDGVRLANRERLERSLLKARAQFGITFTTAEHEAFVKRMSPARAAS
jgi:3-deoxy-D-manno-octulosonic acid kinase